MKRTFELLFLGMISMGLLTVSACQQDDDDMVDPGNEQEVITTVQIYFTPDAGGDALTFVFSDEDGPGGNSPLVDEIVLAANTSYEVTVDFIDRSNPSDVEFITEEVEEEAEEHLVCYTVSGDVPGLTTKDQDVNGDPLGLIAAITTGAAGNGTLTVSLKHEPMKGATAPCTTGETDVEATFQVMIQ